MPLSANQRLIHFYAQFCGKDNVLVLINADPDAIACAMAVKRLLWRKAASVTIASVNTVKRPDNIAMIRFMGVNLIHAGKVDQRQISRVVIVDSQPDHHECFGMFKPDVVIDHHPPTCEVGRFVDIRPEYGAAASMMTEYLRSAGIKPSLKLATALFLAIKVDTKNFEQKATTEDLRAFRFLFKYANLHLVRKIENACISVDFLKYYSIALKARRFSRGRFFAHLGPVANPDVCVLIADFFMGVDCAKWSIVSGVYKAKLVIIFRNDGNRKNAGSLAQKKFGSFGSAGGHKSMARAEIDVEELEGKVDYRDRKKLGQWVVNRFVKRQ